MECRSCLDPVLERVGDTLMLYCAECGHSETAYVKPSTRLLVTRWQLNELARPPMPVDGLLGLVANG